MTQNLDLDLSTGKALTPARSDDVDELDAGVCILLQPHFTR